MFFLAPLIGGILSGGGAIASGAALSSAAAAAATAGGAIAGGAALGSALAAAGTGGAALAAGVKVLTLEEATKYVGAAVIGAHLAKNRKRPVPPVPGPDGPYENQGQSRKQPKLICYVQTDEGIVPLYDER